MLVTARFRTHTEHDLDGARWFLLGRHLPCPLELGVASLTALVGFYCDRDSGNHRNDENDKEAKRLRV